MYGILTMGYKTVITKKKRKKTDKQITTHRKPTTKKKRKKCVRKIKTERKWRKMNSFFCFISYEVNFVINQTVMFSGTSLKRCFLAVLSFLIAS